MKQQPIFREKRLPKRLSYDEKNLAFARGVLANPILHHPFNVEIAKATMRRLGTPEEKAKYATE